MYTEIYKCRICKNRNLLSVLNLGLQSFTGIFPKKISQGYQVSKEKYFPTKIKGI